MQLKIEYVDIDTLKAYKGNAKLHPAEQIEQIKKSIQEFGMDDPIIEGHGRLIACKELGMKTVPIVRLDNLTDDQRKQYALIHNKLTMNSGFDMDLLYDELEKLDGLSLRMSDFGFDELEKIANEFSESVSATTQNSGTTYQSEEYDPYAPEPYDDKLIQEYTDHQEDYILKKRIIITYHEEQEEELAQKLKVKQIDRVVYDFEELFS